MVGGTAAIRSKPRTGLLLVQLIEHLGGRFSRGLGINVDGGEREVERWFLAARLFGARIRASVAEETYRVLSEAGVSTIADVARTPRGRLIELLDRGGYARYDERTATQLLDLARIIAERHGGRVSSLATRNADELKHALDALPGWGPTTVRIFLRELRGVWRGAAPPIDERALAAAGHLRLTRQATRERMEEAVKKVATDAHVDLRDLETALIRLALHHRDDFAGCVGGRACLESLLERADTS